MAARKTAAKKTEEPTLEEAAAAVADAPPEQPQQNGVFVQVIDDGDGVRTTIQTIGTTRVTEVQTILELGLKAFRNDAGLS